MLRENKYLKDLHPVFKQKAETLLRSFRDAGIGYEIIDGSRPWDVQYWAFFIQKKPGTVAPWQSYHVKRRALDIVFTGGEAGRNRAKEAVKRSGLRAVDEKRFGYTHLHIDDAGDEADYLTDHKKAVLAGLAFFAAGIGLGYYLKKKGVKPENLLFWKRGKHGGLNQ